MAEPLSWEQNPDLIDSLASYDHQAEIEGKLNREYILSLLKPDERLVVELLEDGYNYREIGEKMGKSTVWAWKMHRWIRVKLGE